MPEPGGQGKQIYYYLQAVARSDARAPASPLSDVTAPHERQDDVWGLGLLGMHISAESLRLLVKSGCPSQAWPGVLNKLLLGLEWLQAVVRSDARTPAWPLSDELWQDSEACGSR